MPDQPQPQPEALKAFWHPHRDRFPRVSGNPAPYARCIGFDAGTADQVLALIAAGDKTGTYSAGPLIERTGRPEPRPGDPIIFIDFTGRPRILARITAVETVKFHDINENHTAIDGPPVRDPATWKALHIDYWNRLMRPFGLSVTDKMTVTVERFELVSIADC